MERQQVQPGLPQGSPSGSEERSYEQLVHDLEACVRDLEEGRLPLEKAIDRFKDGVALVKLAEQRLQTAEGQVNLLLQGEEGRDRKEPFAGTPSEAPRGQRLATSASPLPAGRSAGPAAGSQADDDFPT